MKQQKISPIDSDLVMLAINLAYSTHRKVQHMYDGQPYFSAHLEPVVDVALEFITLIPEDDRSDVIAACFCHDLLEDCGAHVNYNTLKNTLNVAVAEMVFAVTNDKGRNTYERESETYFEGIRNTKYATFIKLCDRISNSRYGASHGGNNKHFLLYVSTANDFCIKLYDPKYHNMFSALREALKI